MLRLGRYSLFHELTLYRRNLAFKMYCCNPQLTIYERLRYHMHLLRQALDRATKGTTCTSAPRPGVCTVAVGAVC